MQWIEYDYVCNQRKGIVFHKKVEYNEANLTVAKSEAVNGAYFITEDEDAQPKGQLAVEFGGTGAHNVSEARRNLEVAQAIESADYPGCYYRMRGEEIEWLNPPMQVNTEYRTTERFNGTPVYTVVTTRKTGSAIMGSVSINYKLPKGSVSMILRHACWTSNGLNLPTNLHNPDASDHRRVEVYKSTMGDGYIACTGYMSQNVVDANEEWYVQFWYTKLNAFPSPGVGM